jgi:LysR family transcriptional regulator, carnitine catabolism transcriptional activator
VSIDNLSLQQIRVFREVARSGSFTVAARRINASQSSLSRTVRQLERVLGATLLQRDTRNVVVTAEGAQFLDLAERVLRDLGDGIERFDRFAKARGGVLSIATLASVAAVILPSIISELVVSNAEMSLHLIDAANDQVLQRVSDGEVELAVGMAPPEGYADLRATAVLEDAVWAVVPVSHPWAGRTHVTWADFDGETFIAAIPGTSTRALSDAGLERSGASVWNRLDVANLATLGGLVRAGLGVSALPTIEFETYRLDDLTRVPIRDHGATRVLSVITSRERPLSPTARRFVAVVPDVLSRLALPAGLTRVTPG